MNLHEIEVVHDASVRVVRILEALADGDYDLASWIAENLELDLQSALERAKDGAP
jgi:hypothetical protein